MEHSAIQNMAMLRIISGLLEITVAWLFIKIGRVDAALRLNAFLGLAGPVIFILVSVLGIAVIAVKLSWFKIALLCLGLILVIIGTKI